MTFFSSSLSTFSTPSISYSASYSGRRYGSTFCDRSPGRKPSFSPASTAGRTSTSRCTRDSFKASTALATARKVLPVPAGRSEEHTSELQSLMRISYAVFCLKKKKKQDNLNTTHKHKQQKESH